jgi:hypothetical protein
VWHNILTALRMLVKLVKLIKMRLIETYSGFPAHKSQEQGDPALLSHFNLTAQ